MLCLHYNDFGCYHRDEELLLPGVWPLITVLWCIIALISAPIMIIKLVIYNHKNKIMIPAKLPYVLL